MRAWAAWRTGEELDNYTTGEETLTFSKERRAVRRTTGHGREISLAFIRQKVVRGEEQQRESHGGGKLDNPRDATHRDQSPPTDSVCETEQDSGASSQSSGNRDTSANQQHWTACLTVVRAVYQWETKLPSPQE